MGTRNLTAVVKDGQFKIAQYGQWDGYPSGQGATALRFLREQESLDAFRDAVDRCYFYTDEQIEELDPAFATQLASPNAKAMRYEAGSLTHLSRDVGAEILDIVLHRTDNQIGLVDSRGFAGDSLFCEWAYIVDLDAGVFEAYEGFNETPTPADSRFPSGADWLDKSDGYQPVRLVGSWPLDALPTVEEFCAALENAEEED